MPGNLITPGQLSAGAIVLGGETVVALTGGLAGDWWRAVVAVRGPVRPAGESRPTCFGGGDNAISRTRATHARIVR